MERKDSFGKEQILHWLEAHQKDFIDISNGIWEYAESRFQEQQSSALQCRYLEQAGFTVRKNLAGEETAFLAEYGRGKPVIAFLGEFDALEGLSQKADLSAPEPVVSGGNGHGCGHNLLGAASMAAAAALKVYLEQTGVPGTVRYYGCPAEENAGGKAYLVRDGYFDDCDLALTWHPATVNRVLGHGSLANFRVFFTFHGISAHAAGAPHLGRSALDAVELMNVGVNYMREHMIDEARVHYAVTDTGGNAPNVVQPRAQVLYAIRAPRVGQVKELYERVCDIARGAALMTQTTVEIRQVAAYSDYIGNDSLAQVLQRNLESRLPLAYTREEQAYAERFHAAITELDKANLKSNTVKLMGKELAAAHSEDAIMNFAVPYDPHASSGGSTDVGDVSWVVPTGQVNTATWAYGTAGHSWQVTAQGKSSNAHKAMFLAAETLALTGLEYLTDDKLLQAAKAAWLEALDGETYPNPLPPDVKPAVW